MLANVDIILHRPQASENVGATARAMKNFGLSRLVLVSPRRYEPTRAATLAVQSEEILENARLALTLDEAIAPYSLVIPTTERAVPGRPPPLGPRDTARKLLTTAATGRVALLFGEEATGISNEVLARFHDYSSIPAHPERRSLNLAQAVLLYSWELFQASGDVPVLERPDRPDPREAPSPHQLLSLLRDGSRKLLLGAGFLNAQNPDRALDELMRLVQRANPSQREVEMLLAAIAQLERTSVQR